MKYHINESVLFSVFILLLLGIAVYGSFSHLPTGHAVYSQLGNTCKNYFGDAICDDSPEDCGAHFKPYSMPSCDECQTFMDGKAGFDKCAGSGGVGQPSASSVQSTAKPSPSSSKSTVSPAQQAAKGSLNSCSKSDGSNYCGGKSAGSCYCDSYCTTAGDCCGDYEETCVAPKPVTQPIIESSSGEPKDSQTGLIGDFDGNGCVDMDDFFLFSDAFGSNNPVFDITKDQIIGFDDFFIFSEHFGDGCMEKMEKILKETEDIDSDQEAGQESQEDPCNIKDYKMAFILVENEENSATQKDIKTINEIKSSFSEKFAKATRNLATMDTSHPVVVIKWNGDIITFAHEITGLFYEDYPDDFHFFTIYSTYEKIQGVSTYHQNAQNKIHGITLSQNVFDGVEHFNSNGKKLLGLNFMGNIRKYEDHAHFPEGAVNGLLHETGHQWCCYVGDNFARGENNAELEVISQGMHFYSGLQSPYGDSTPLGSHAWVSNDDETFKIRDKPELDYEKYHPFQLYFMGLLPEDEYDDKYQVYDAGIDSHEMNWNSAPLYKEVSVNDIIAVMGERFCS